MRTILITINTTQYEWKKGGGGASINHGNLKPPLVRLEWRDDPNEEASAKVDRYSHHFERNDGALSH